MSEQQQRENIIVRTSVIGITVNLMLAAFKAAGLTIPRLGAIKAPPATGVGTAGATLGKTGAACGTPTTEGTTAGAATGTLPGTIAG